MEHDFEVTISVVEGEFNIDATGDVGDIAKGVILAIATIMDVLKKDNVSDEELETSVLEEYRRAKEFVKWQGTNCEVSMK